MHFTLLDIHWIAVILVGLFYLVIGSLSDLKSREVFDYANFSLIVVGVALNLLYSSVTGTWTVALGSCIGLLLFIGIAYLMYYAGQWGGGDSKMLMGLGALIGIPLSLKEFPFLFDFLIDSLFVGAIYGMVWTIVLAIKHWKKVRSELKNKLGSKQMKKRKRYLLFLILILLTLAVLAALFNNQLIVMFSFALMLIAVVSFYLWIFVKSIEHAVMYKQLEIERLTEGDWIVDDIVVDGKYITGPKDLGISKESIEKLLALKKKDKIKTVLVKEGIPFVPSFFFAFILALFFRNVWWVF